MSVWLKHVVSDQMIVDIRSVYMMGTEGHPWGRNQHFSGSIWYPYGNFKLFFTILNKYLSAENVVSDALDYDRGIRKNLDT